MCVALTEQLMTNGNISRARASHFPTEEKLVQVLALYKIAENPVPDTLYPSRGNMDHVPGTLYRVPCTGYLGPCTGYLVPGTLHYFIRDIPLYVAVACPRGRRDRK